MGFGLGLGSLFFEKSSSSQIGQARRFLVVSYCEEGQDEVEDAGVVELGGIVEPDVLALIVVLVKEEEAVGDGRGKGRRGWRQRCE